MNRAVFVDLFPGIFDKHGIYALTAVLKQEGVAVEYVTTHKPQIALRAVQRLRPDLVLYSALSSQVPGFSAFDARLKGIAPLFSIIGGPGPTFDPASLATSTIDAYVVGEGEEAIRQFVRTGTTSGSNLVPRNAPAPSTLPPFPDLDALPMPDRSAVYRRDPVLRDSRSKQFVSGRGCPFACSYCFNHAFNRMSRGCGPVVRKKSVDRLIEEVRAVRKDYPFDLAVFQDDVFPINPSWFAEFAERFPREVGIPYTCNVRADLTDRDVVRRLHDSGCICVHWSIESGNDRIRDQVLRRHMTRAQIQTAGRLFAEYGIRQRVGHLLGLPGETRAEMIETLALSQEVRPDYACAYIFVPYPGLDLTNQAIREGHLDPKPRDPLPTNTHRPSVLKMPPRDARWIRKLAFLFPFFVEFPSLYRRGALRKAAFRLPVPLLWLAYQGIDAVKMTRLYRVRAPLGHAVRMAARLLREG